MDWGKLKARFVENKTTVLCAAAALLCIVIYLLYGHIHQSQLNEASLNDKHARLANCFSTDILSFDENCIEQAISSGFETSDRASTLIAQQDMAKWSALMLVVTSVGVIFVALTLNETKNASAAAIRAVSEAKSANEGFQLSSERELRAYAHFLKLHINPPGPGGGVEIDVHWKNYGKTPTKQGGVKCSIAVFNREPTINDISFKNDVPLALQDIPPNEEIKTKGPTLGFEDHFKLKHGLTRVFVYGFFEYFDAISASPNKHRSEFLCEVTYADRDHKYLFSRLQFHNGWDESSSRGPLT